MGFGRIVQLWNKKNSAETKFNFTQATKRCSLPGTEKIEFWDCFSLYFSCTFEEMNKDLDIVSFLCYELLSWWFGW